MTIQGGADIENKTTAGLRSPLGRAEFEAELRRLTEEGYYDKHPFHVRLHAGRLKREDVSTWALNRYYFQNVVPRKDAILISRSDCRVFRREWTLRLLDHDGFGKDEGGLERWLKLTDGLGLERETVTSMRDVLPETKAIIETYLDFAREKPFAAVVATTLTELFAPKLHRERLAAMLAAYDFIDVETLSYFKKRLTHAPRDASFALEYVLDHAITADDQEACFEAVRFKCRMLWSLLDVLERHCFPGEVVSFPQRRAGD